MPFQIETIAGERIKAISLEVWNNDDPEWVTAVHIQTTKEKFVIEVDLDELKIESGSEIEPSNNPETSIISVANTHPLSTLIDKQIIWAWRLINNQGYQDGFQMEVENKTDPIVIQFLALASQIKIFQTQSLPLLQLSTHWKFSY